MIFAYTFINSRGKKDIKYIETYSQANAHQQLQDSRVEYIELYECK